MYRLPIRCRNLGLKNILHTHRLGLHSHCSTLCAVREIRFIVWYGVLGTYAVVQWIQCTSTGSTSSKLTTVNVWFFLFFFNEVSGAASNSVY
jgi:hypothetical protein